VSVSDYSGDSAPSAWTIMQGVGRRMVDVQVSAIEDRTKIAIAEWEAWTLCEEVLQLQHLQAERDCLDGIELPIEQELRVWAPRSYDRDVSELEWSRTPMEVRMGWQARVEALSFAVLRHSQAGDEIMRQAMVMTCTGERLELGIERMRLLKALSVARLSFRNSGNPGEQP
jgi:hypothetical protein